MGWGDKVWGSGFGAHGLGSKVWGLEFGVEMYSQTRKANEELTMTYCQNFLFPPLTTTDAHDTTTSCT